MAELPAPESALTDMIYRAWEERAESWDDLGFSPSLLGTECDRALWYQLHWAPAKERFDGRMLRLFRTGQIEEDRIIEDLIMCGLDVDPVDPATGKQFNVRALAGHVRGKTDGRINSGVPEAPKKTHIVEAKSHSEKSFNKLVQAGPGNLIEGKFDHWVQCQVYMHVLGIDRTLYSATCKNTDRRWNDRVKYDHEFGVWLFARLKRIIESPRPAPPISAKRNAPDCRFCKAKPLCLGESFARLNCRTCLHSTPLLTGDASWDCARWSKPLTADEQRAACPAHLFVPDLVPGEVIDTDEEAETVTYRLNDGRLWTDGRDTSDEPVAGESDPDKRERE